MPLGSFIDIAKPEVRHMIPGSAVFVFVKQRMSLAKTKESEGSYDTPDLRLERVVRSYRTAFF